MRLLRGVLSLLFSSVAHVGMFNSFLNLRLLNTSMLRHFLSSHKMIFLKFFLRLLRLFAANQ